MFFFCLVCTSQFIPPIDIYRMYTARGILFVSCLSTKHFYEYTLIHYKEIKKALKKITYYFAYLCQILALCMYSFWNWYIQFHSLLVSIYLLNSNNIVIYCSFPWPWISRKWDDIELTLKPYLQSHVMRVQRTFYFYNNNSNDYKKGPNEQISAFHHRRRPLDQNILLLTLM